MSDKEKTDEVQVPTAHASLLSEPIVLPKPSDDQREYISKIRDWTKNSYDPESVIGGPAKRRVE